MAPEQAMACRGTAGDIFALGSMLVFAATGRGPYGDGTQAELLYRVAHQVPSLDDVRRCGRWSSRAWRRNRSGGRPPAT